MPTWGKSFSLELASLSWTDIGLAAGVGANQLVAVVHVVDAVPLDGGGGGDADLGEVVLVGVGQLVVDRLPEELAVRLAEAHQDALVVLDLRVARLVVVGADVDLAAGDDRAAV